MRKFLEFLLHLFSSFCLLTLFSLLSIFYDIRLYEALNSWGLNEITSDANRIYKFHVAGLLFRYFAITAASIISLYLLRRTNKTYWIAGAVFVISIIGMHLKVQNLFFYIRFSTYFFSEFYIYILIDTLFIIALASTSYYFSYFVAKKE